MFDVYLLSVIVNDRPKFIGDGPVDEKIVKVFESCLVEVKLHPVDGGGEFRCFNFKRLSYAVEEKIVIGDSHRGVDEDNGVLQEVQVH